MGDKDNPFSNTNLNIRITPESSVIADYDFETNTAYIETHAPVQATVAVRLEDMDAIEFAHILNNLKCSQNLINKKEYRDILMKNPAFTSFEPSRVIVYTILNQEMIKQLTAYEAGPHNHNRNMLRAALTGLVKDNTIFILPHGEYTIHAANENTAMEYFDNVPYIIKRLTEYPKAVYKYDRQTGRNHIIGVLYKGNYIMQDGTEKDGYIFCCEQKSIGVQPVKVIREYINRMADTREKHK